jgi:hypothetical protein
MNVCAFDQPGYQTDTDSTTGETILPDEGNQLLGGVVGVIWSEIFWRDFAQLVLLCPEGSTPTFKTH